MDNIVALHEDLATPAPPGCGAGYTYQHGGYIDFFISDPKRRHIHKASVRDRLLHHAIYRILYPFFDKTFIGDSYSCRIDKGTHKAINRFRALAFQVSQNHMRTCWVLKCDIRKFFSSIDHKILFNILNQYIPDKDILWLLENVVQSFNAGLPLGNLTSQLFANVYMDVFDQFVKHKLKAKYYIRYADDFVILSDNKYWLEKQKLKIKDFLQTELLLDLHPNKVSIETITSGVDFLGWKLFVDHRVLRTKIKNRMLIRIKQNSKKSTIDSYLGLIKYGNSFKLKQKISKKVLVSLA